jgi:hypothetical protein
LSGRERGKEGRKVEDDYLVISIVGLKDEE